MDTTPKYHDVVKDATAYIFLLRSKLEGTGAFVLYAKAKQDGNLEYRKFADVYVDLTVISRFLDKDEEPIKQWHLFDAPIDGEVFHHELDTVVNSGILENRPESIGYSSANRRDYINIRTFDGRKGFYEVGPECRNDSRYKLVLGILRRYDPEGRFEKLTSF